jgi:hypothetical protein
LYNASNADSLTPLANYSLNTVAYMPSLGEGVVISASATGKIYWATSGANFFNADPSSPIPRLLVFNAASGGNFTGLYDGVAAPSRDYVFGAGVMNGGC